MKSFVQTPPLIPIHGTSTHSRYLHVPHTCSGLGNKLTITAL